jgi:hypothetical protein
MYQVSRVANSALIALFLWLAGCTSAGKLASLDVPERAGPGSLELTLSPRNLDLVQSSHEDIPIVLTFRNGSPEEVRLPMFLTHSPYDLGIHFELAAGLELFAALQESYMDPDAPRDIFDNKRLKKTDMISLAPGESREIRADLRCFRHPDSGFPDQGSYRVRVRFVSVAEVPFWHGEIYSNWISVKIRWPSE